MATDDAAVTRAVAADGRARSVWVNAADEPARCDFILPSAMRRGRLVVAVSTGGASPAAARAIREELEGYLTEEHAALVELAAEARETCAAPAVAGSCRLARRARRPAATAHRGPALPSGPRVSGVTARVGMTAPGRVYLVGAGPGDPGLMTVRGLELLRQARVVVYDRLVNPALLDEAPPGALRIFAASARAPTASQAQINAC